MLKLAIFQSELLALSNDAKSLFLFVALLM